MERRIVGFHQDAEEQSVAELECGHRQHVRHDLPWECRPWVVTAEGRASRLRWRVTKRLNLTGAAILISRASTSFQAAPAA